MVEEKVNLWWARVKHILQQTCVGLNKWEVLRCKVVLGRMGEGSNGDGGGNDEENVQCENGK